MSITLTVFANSPDGGRGLARDMPVRWALEEASLAYAVRTVSFTAMKQAEHRSRNPFGQIPAFEETRPEAPPLVLFESGAIVLHLAHGHPGLLPNAPDPRARTVMWIFAALSTVEPPVVERSMAVLFERDRPWHAERLATLDERVHTRLSELAAWLGDKDWLEGAFTAGDLMMVSVLRRLSGSGLLDSHPSIAAYVARAEERPAFRRAFDAQLALFTAARDAPG